MTLKSLIPPLLGLTQVLSFQLIAKELNLLMWEDTLSEHVVQQWQVQSGNTLHITHFDSNDDRDTLLTANNNLPFDILILDNVSSKIYGQLGGLVDVSQISNRSHNRERWNNACGDYGQPYFWGVIGIVYRSDKVQQPPKKWRDFINPPTELSGHIGLLNDTTDSFLPFFASRGISSETENSHALKQVYSTMLSFNHHVLTYQYPLSFIGSNKNADKLYMAVGYSGDEHLLNRTQNIEHWKFVLPEERPSLWLDCLTINQHSDNKEIAKQFLNYLSDPIIAAKNATEIKAATTNVSALKLVPAWYLNGASLLPEEKHISQGQIDSPLSSENISLRAKILSQLLNDHETQH
ncbi:spermidine/putrescine ABC transporter substrate-binding protein [Vibrio kasasachensis]|uniref:polyamine ABC transporter substrate-binding protein n=1 Tax=Vibrio kasasachensis TaxID=2910248 RepID=UPI003D0D9DFA